MGAIVKCPTCEHQTRYDSSEIVERGGLWVVNCTDCGNVVPIKRVKSIEDLMREAMAEQEK